MKVTRRQTLIGAAAASVALKAPALAQAKPHAGKEVKVLTVRAAQFKAQEARLPEFEAETGIKVQFVDIPFPAMREKLTAEMVAGSNDFDVANMMDVWIPPLVDKYLAPIGKEVAARGIDVKRYPDAFLRAGQFNNDVYGLPIRNHIQLLFYRKDVFTELGLQPPKTWDEVVAVSKTIQEKKPDLAGIAIPYGKNNGQNLMVWYNFLWGAGGDVYDANLRPVFNSAAGIRATQDYVDLMLKHKVTPNGAASFQEQDAVTSMVSGKSAMVPVWWHVYNRFAMPESAVKLPQVGFVPLPTYAGSAPTTYTNNWIYGLNKNAKQRDAALEFMRWACRPEMERSILLDPKENEVVACQWSNLRDADVNRRFNGMHLLAANALEKTKSIPNIPEFLPTVDILEVAMSNIATGQAKVEDALNAAAAQVARVMRR